MICACWGETTTMRNWLDGTVHELLVDGSQNCIVPRPSAPIEYVPENAMGVCGMRGGCGFMSSVPLMMCPEPSAVKVPARARKVFPETTLPLMENTKEPCNAAVPKVSVTGTQSV